MASPGHGRQYRGIIGREQRWRCIWCGVKIDDTAPHGHPNKATIEHIRPRSEGGRSTRENLAVACLKCNTNRRSQRPDEGALVTAARVRAERFAALSVARKATA